LAGLLTSAAAFAVALLAVAFTSTSSDFDFLATLAGADVAATTLALLAGITIPRVKAHRNGDKRGWLGKSIGVGSSGKLWGRTFGMQSLRWSDQMAKSICWSGPEVLLSRLP
jgi:hypothetical protein